MERYFELSPNIMAVNCIHTDVQSRMNGEDSTNQGRFWGNSVQKRRGELRESYSSAMEIRSQACEGHKSSKWVQRLIHEKTNQYREHERRAP